MAEGEEPKSATSNLERTVEQHRMSFQESIRTEDGHSLEDRLETNKSLFATASRFSVLLTKRRRGEAEAQVLALRNEFWHSRKGVRLASRDRRDEGMRAGSKGYLRRSKRTVRVM